MKTASRILCLLLVICLATISLVACGGDESQPQTSQDTSVAQNGVDENSFRLEKKDFGGIEIHFLTDQANDYLMCEISPESIGDDIVQAATYNRAKRIEQEYGIKLIQHYAENQEDIKNQAYTQITTDLNEYQVYCAGLVYLAPWAIEGYFLDFNAITANNYIDLKQPYWDQSVNKDLEVLGSTYMITGDALISDDESTWAIYFNKQIANDNHVTDPYNANNLYEMVANNTWTIDTLHEMAKSVARTDNNGDMLYSTSTSTIWGMVSETYDSFTFMVGCGESLTRNENGIPVLTIAEESNFKAYDKVFSLLKDKSCVAIQELDNPSQYAYDDLVQIFANGSALFMPNKIGQVNTGIMRNANIEFGILPMPKVSEDQDDYHSTVTNYWFSAFALPHNAANNKETFDATCYALEALAYYGMRDVTPEYYERTLKDRRFADNESLEMLDLIFRNRSFDIGGVFNTSILGFYTNLLFSADNTHVSKAEEYKISYQTILDDFIDQVKASKA